MRQISVEDLRTAVSTAKWEWVILAIGVVVASTFLKAVRWRTLFHPQQVPLGRAWSVFMVGQMLNTLLPARAGEVSRIYLIGEENTVSRTTALSTVVVEKAVDLTMLTLAYLVVAMWLATTPIGLPEWLQDAGRGLIPLAVLALTAILLLARFGRPLWQILQRWLTPIPRQWRTATEASAEKALTALGGLQHSGMQAQIWLWSFLIWALMALTNGLVLTAFGIILSPFVSILLLVVLMSGVAVPPLPGNLGVFVFLCILVLSLFDVSRETALVYGITLQLVAYLPLILLGLACLAWENWHLRRSPSGSRPAR
jgi:uncharacterized protein (TIRG00374 family)